MPEAQSRRHPTRWLALLLLFLPAFALADTAADVIAMAKAQWAAEMGRQSADAILKDVADDYTEFNPDVPTRLDGKAMALKATEAFNADPSRTVMAEMINPKVQVYGDVAILTYNYVGLIKDKDSKVTSINAKSTRVYAKMGGHCQLVHANFAPIAAAAQP